MPPPFSVVIPTYNRRERLLRAVRSVLAQTSNDYEIIVVDDGSTDGTLDALAQLGGPVVPIRQKNGGPAAARTAGARAAKGTYVAFLDSDDTWFPWTLATLARAVTDHGQPAWLYGPGVTMGEPGADAAHGGALVARRFSDYWVAAAVDGLMPMPTGVALRRDLFLGAGGFHAAMRVGEDVDLWFRLGDAAGFVLLEGPPLYAREVHEGSLGEDPAHSYAGMMELLRRERAGVYGARAGEVRRAILSRQLMYYAERYRRRGDGARSARFYLEVLRLQAEDRFREPRFGGRRNRFLVTFPLYFVSPKLHAQVLRLAPGRKRPAAGTVFDRG